MQLILYAVPFFFLLIAIELSYDQWRGTGYYKLVDAITSLSTGVLNLVMDVFKLLVPFAIYALVFDALALMQWQDSALLWIAAFVLYDFFYYWNHRMGHEINLLWAAHVVHHSSEEYNLTTALRQTGSGFLSVFFYLPMAILGIEPLMLLTVGALNLIYQFWVHTRHIKKLGWFDYVFVSPSNHRVHHAKNPVYLDRNYGGVFILWDRLFGTFQPELEEEEVRYGVTKSLNSWNPIYANLQVYQQLVHSSLATSKWQDKIKLWFMHPGWLPADVAELKSIEGAELRHGHSATLKLYFIGQYMLHAGVALWLVISLTSLTTVQSLGIIAVLLLSNFSLGRLMDHRSNALTCEALKNVSTLIAFLWWQTDSSTLNYAVSILCLISLTLLYRHRSNEMYVTG